MFITEIEIHEQTKTSRLGKRNQRHIGPKEEVLGLEKRSLINCYGISNFIFIYQMSICNESKNGIKTGLIF